jgi:Uma2 family endonuclease
MSWVNTSPLVKTYTLEEFWALPDPLKAELIAGVIYLTPGSSPPHDDIVSRLVRQMVTDPSLADLVIEVISPGSAIYDRNTKADTYAQLGVKELWLVDETGENIEVRTLAKGKFARGKMFAKGDRLNSLVLPGLTFEVSRIFGDE